MASDPRETLLKKRVRRSAAIVAAPREMPAEETPLERISRDLAILNMRLHGLTFYEISRKLPEAGFRRVSVSRVFAIVAKALRSCQEQPARELRQLELLRLDQLQAAHYKAAMSGDAAAATRVLAIMDRRAKLLGFDGGAETTGSLDQAKQSLLTKLEALARGQASGAGKTVAKKETK